MNYTDMTVPKFDALLAKTIALYHCPKCHNYGGQIIVDMPMYGKEGVYCKCYKCGFETKRRSAHIFMRDKTNRMATPIIDKSFMQAIHTAVNDWNRRANDE